jgi:hypothetical protein
MNLDVDALKKRMREVDVGNQGIALPQSGRAVDRQMASAQGAQEE